jgi:hypothetical protein
MSTHLFMHVALPEPERAKLADARHELPHGEVPLAATNRQAYTEDRASIWWSASNTCQ